MLARERKEPCSLLPTSEGGLCLQSVTVLLLSNPLPEEALLTQSPGRTSVQAIFDLKGCLLFLGKLSLTFSCGTLWFVSPSPLRRLRKNSPSASVLPVEGHLFGFGQRKLDSNPHFWGYPVVKIPCFHCSGHGFDSWSVCMPHGMAKERRKSHSS